MATKAHCDAVDSRDDFVVSAEAELNASDIPLVVEVDGTLLRTNTLLESAISLLSTQPLEALKVPLWLYSGKAHLRSEIADRIAINVQLLPMDSTVLEFMRSEKLRGRRVFLVSASDRRFVAAIAARIGFVDGVFAGDRTTDLSIAVKRNLLVQSFGERRFDYIGNSQRDRLILSVARRGYVVCNGVFEQFRLSQSQTRGLEVLVKRPVQLRDIGKSLRLHQWAKNLLLFVPLVLGGASGNPVLVMKSFVCFLAFGVIASSTYLINDMLDLTNDRQHPNKQQRPLASGQITIQIACGLVLLGLGIGLSIGAFLGLAVFLALLGYLAATLAYSLVLKSKPILDVVLLAGLYTWRLFVGVLVANVLLSPWLMVFSFAFFLSLSLTKRHVEINGMLERGVTILPGRGYQPLDGAFVLSMGVASGVSSILIFVLYLIEGAFHAAYFHRPEMLWICPVVLLLWLCRIWLLSARGLLHEDPVVFAVIDRKSLLLGGIGALGVLAAILG
jgi:4-hydroxybenzoate polyprenyltransferase